MSSETLNIILIILVVVVAGIAVYQKSKRGEAIGGELVVSEVKQAIPVAQELIAIATVGVQAAEQLKNTGKLPSNDAAFDYALNFVKKWIPATAGVDNADIKAAIESAVLVANFMSDQLKNRSVTSTPSAPPQTLVGRTGLQ